MGLTGEPTAPVIGSGGADEQELVPAVGGAVGGERLEVPHLADRQARCSG